MYSLYTYLIPGTVTEVSAILVAITHFLISGFDKDANTLFCSWGGSDPYSGKMDSLDTWLAIWYDNFPSV